MNETVHFCIGCNERCAPEDNLCPRCEAALEIGAPTYRFLRRYLERRPAAPLTLRQVDPLIRQLTLYRDLIDRKTGDTL